MEKDADLVLNHGFPEVPALDVEVVVMVGVEDLDGFHHIPLEGVADLID